jgi:hypothetical protein
MIGPDPWGVCYYNNQGFNGLAITKERIDPFKMALEGEFPSEDPLKREEFFDAGDGLCVVKWKLGIDGENHMMCDCTRFWKCTVCQHAYHFRHGNPKLSKTGGGKTLGPKRVLRYNQSQLYVRGRTPPKVSGFMKPS